MYRMFSAFGKDLHELVKWQCHDGRGDYHRHDYEYVANGRSGEEFSTLKHK
jgi:hypothetical protein